MSTQNTYASAPALAAQHTAGPWHIWHEHPANVGYVEPSEYNNWQLVPIATPCGTIRLLTEGDTSNRRKANARLIAAAPELLAFAESVAVLGRLSYHATTPEQFTAIIDAARAVVRNVNTTT